MDPRDKWREVRTMDMPVSLTLGPNTGDRYLGDPKRIGFMIARYKFAAKMLRDCNSILEIGCGDGFGTLLIAHDTKAEVTGIDFDEELIAYANNHLKEAIRRASLPYDLRFMADDFLDMSAIYTDGCVCLDVVEHLRPDQGIVFFRKIAHNLLSSGVAVIGTPNALAAQYASPHSQVGHINLYDPDRLRQELGEAFRHVFLFSMNDEMVHTGFDRLAHYLIALCVK